MCAGRQQKSNLMQYPYSAPQEKNFELSYVIFRQKIKKLQLIMYLIWSTPKMPKGECMNCTKNGHRKVPMANIDLLKKTASLTLSASILHN